MNSILLADIITVISCLILVVGAIYSGRKTAAEAASAYSNAAASAVGSQQKLQEQIDELRERLDEKDRKIEELETRIQELSDLNVHKDGRIAELEALTISQQNEINRLKTELNNLTKTSSAHAGSEPASAR